MSAANETPRECRPALFGMSAVHCANNCGQHCIIQFPATVNAELAAERAKHKAAEGNLAEARRQLLSTTARVESAESRLKDALFDLANSRSGMVEANKRWTDALAALDSLKDPATLCVNMIRGTIAKPDIRSLLHVHGEAALQTWDRAIATQEAGYDR